MVEEQANRAEQATERAERAVEKMEQAEVEERTVKTEQAVNSVVEERKTDINLAGVAKWAGIAMTVIVVASYFIVKAVLDYNLEQRKMKMQERERERAEGRDDGFPW